MTESIAPFFKNELGTKPEAVSRAPGRLEILGNHTDYNEGLVLSAAVGQATEFAIRRKPGRKCTMRDFRDGSTVEFDLDHIETPVRGDWTNYVKGVIVQLRKRGHEIGAFDGAILSTVPLSAGMSSSAALEISACFAFSKVFGIKLDGSEWARLGQAVENQYMGVGTGLLDQFSSIYGKKDSLIYCDFRTVNVLRTVKMPSGFVIVVANSMIKHNLVDSEYNERRASCENAARILKKTYPEVNALRDVSPEMLENASKSLAKRDYMRAAHVVGENDRVIRGVSALERGDIAAFGKMLYESHQSSMSNFENSCPELDCLVELSTSLPGCAGARLSGGGFGGISIHLVEAATAQEYCERLKTAYRLRTGKETETIVCSIGDGASVT
ncbi:MAG: galactokinase [Lentisphaerae bacterium GWF2_45_14]|nr:MAG: galactokinase [Lentisphaerae bacterium GWF2_45_14]